MISSSKNDGEKKVRNNQEHVTQFASGYSPRSRRNDKFKVHPSWDICRHVSFVQLLTPPFLSSPTSTLAHIAMPIYSDALTDDPDLIAIFNAMTVSNEPPPSTPSRPRAHNARPAEQFAEAQSTDRTSLICLFGTAADTFIRCRDRRQCRQ
jgi:hypothetical protein